MTRMKKKVNFGLEDFKNSFNVLSPECISIFFCVEKSGCQWCYAKMENFSILLYEVILEGIQRQANIKLTDINFQSLLDGLIYYVIVR